MHGGGKVRKRNRRWKGKEIFKEIVRTVIRRKS